MSREPKRFLHRLPRFALVFLTIFTVNLGALAPVFAQVDSAVPISSLRETSSLIPSIALPFKTTGVTFPLTNNFGALENEAARVLGISTEATGGAKSAVGLPKYHNGMDFAMPQGTEIAAVDGGTVIEAGEGDYGLTVVIDHPWGQSVYGHLSKINIEEGKSISKREVIGLSGSTGISTGPHLHFGIRPKDASTNNDYFGFVDPAPYLGLSTSATSESLGVVADSGAPAAFEDIGSQTDYLFNYKFNLAGGASAHFLDKESGRAGYVVADADYQSKIRFFLKDAEGGSAEASGNHVDFPIAVGGLAATLRYTITQGRVKEEIIIDQKPNLEAFGEKLVWNFEMQVDELAMEKAGDPTSPEGLRGASEYVFKSADGLDNWKLHESVYKDANGAGGKVETNIAPTEGNCLVLSASCNVFNLSLSLDKSILETAAYPFVIDPTLTVTNNGAATASPVASDTNVLAMDVSLPAPVSDTFLDSDGTSTTGAGSAAAITAGDALKALAMASGTTLCGNTNGTTAPTNIVLDDSGGCVANTLTTVDSTTSVSTGQYTSIYCLSSTDCKIAYYDVTNTNLMMADCDDATCATKTLTTVDSATSAATGQWTSIYCVATDDCKIAYRDVTNQDLMMADCDDATCSTKTLTTVDSVTSANTGIHTSIYCLSTTDCKISYLDVTNANLMMADCDDATCSTKTLTTVDPNTSIIAGAYTSIYCLSTTDCKIVYQNATNEDITMADCDDATCATKTISESAYISNTGEGAYASIYCVATDDCKIAYWYTLASTGLMMADCSNTACTPGTTTVTKVDPVADSNEGTRTSIYCLSSTDCKISYKSGANQNLMMADCNDVTCATKTLTTVDSVTSANTGDWSSIFCVATDDCKISYYNATNTNLMMADCDISACGSTRTVILGADTSATNTLVSSTSLITFVDTSSNNLWESGEDLYFDVDDSNLYNADTIDAVTVANTGTAVNSTDISTVKLWQDTGSGTFSSAVDTEIDADCVYKAATSNWECDTNTQYTSAPRLFVTVNIAASPTIGGTIKFSIPAISDAGTAGAFDTGDKGVFLAGNYDGPGSAVTNANTQTITQLPVGPTNVAVSVLSTNSKQVQLTWTTVSGAASYNVYRSETNSSQGFTLVGSPTTSGFINDIALDRTYWFYLTSVNSGGGEGTASSVVEIISRSGNVLSSSSSSSTPTGTTSTGTTSTGTSNDTGFSGPFEFSVGEEPIFQEAGGGIAQVEELSIWEKIWGDVLRYIQNAMSFLGRLVSDLFQNIRGLVLSLSSNIRELVLSLFSNIADFINDVIFDVRYLVAILSVLVVTSAGLIFGEPKILGSTVSEVGN